MASPSSKDANKTIVVIKSNAATLLEPIFFFDRLLPQFKWACCLNCNQVNYLNHPSSFIFLLFISSIILFFWRFVVAEANADNPLL